ncbi:zinc-alpha-2-glycoprotein-like [Dromiciops gliroides]|uniref:zinc-alpha-2-glycoprotein-like n=1 Tax=Dromiciops gliroides TaxID=33562 RepID=UPI001CC71B50|nr:zinc-alpha-2-glycoprotein-like [Dromiciops gliroides]
MENQRKRRESLTYWLLVLGVFALNELKAEEKKTSKAQEPTLVEKNPEEPKTLQGHHIHEMLSTGVGTKYSLFNFSIIHAIDDVKVYYYDKEKKTVFGKAWITEALGKDYIEHKKGIIANLEKDFQWLLKFFIQNVTKSEKNHTIQLFADCELDNDIEMDNHIQFAMDGEDFMKIDMQTKHWIAMKPEAEYLRPLAETMMGIKRIEKVMELYCFVMMRKILQYSSVKEKVAPEVSVSRYDAPDGRITFNCTATGFYPHSILLRWEKGGQLGVWGQESSTGTLPNADTTFYVQITLELPPGNSGIGYTCVVEHSTLKTPAVYPVPEKPTVMRPWVVALGVLIVIILVLSCVGAFIMWKKKKGHGIHEHATVNGEKTL